MDRCGGIPVAVQTRYHFQKSVSCPRQDRAKVPFERNFRYSYRVNLRYRLPTPKPALADPKGYPAARRQSQIESHVVDSNSDRQSKPSYDLSSGPLARRSESLCSGQMHCLQKFGRKFAFVFKHFQLLDRQQSTCVSCFPVTLALRSLAGLGIAWRAVLAMSLSPGSRRVNFWLSPFCQVDVTSL